jgi:hypothetical protein
MRLLTTFVLLFAAGCYGAAPPRPSPIELPDAPPGTELTVTAEEITTMEEVPKEAKSCPPGAMADRDCTFTTWTETEPVTRTHVTTTLGETALNFAQFIVLTDPEHDAKLKRLETLSHRCQRANKPRWIGTGLAIAGLVVMGIGAGAESTAVSVTGDLMAVAGIASFAAGYYAFGGKDCNRARDLYLELDYTAEEQMTTVYGPTLAAEMQELAEKFNAGTRMAQER